VLDPVDICLLAIELHGAPSEWAGRRPEGQRLPGCVKQCVLKHCVDASLSDYVAYLTG